VRGPYGGPLSEGLMAEPQYVGHTAEQPFEGVYMVVAIMAEFTVPTMVLVPLQQVSQ
jgi:hypothetical protein